MLLSGVTYYYFGDEIKVYTLSLLDFIKSRGRGPDGNNPPNNSENRNNSWVNRIGWNRNQTRNLNFSEILDDGIGLVDTNPIAGPSSEPLDQYFTTDKGKEVLTSPSLENLNSNVEEGWSNSRPTSPQSVTSSGTITQANIASNVNNPSTKGFKHDEIPKSMLETPINFNDDIFYPNTSTIKPFMSPKVGSKTNITQDNWKLYVNNAIKDRMEFIENTFNSENELDLETANKMIDEIVIIGKSYNSLTEAYDSLKDNLTSRKSNIMKNMAFNMRGWLIEYSSKLFPT